MIKKTKLDKHGLDLAKLKRGAWTLVLTGILCTGVYSVFESMPEGYGGVEGKDPSATVVLFFLCKVGALSAGMMATVRGLAGLFLRYADSGAHSWRYLSDSAYWVYLIHLPLAALVPGLIAGWGGGPYGKSLAACAIVSAVCFSSYDFLVRPTPIGRFLNGRRYPSQNRAISIPVFLLLSSWMAYGLWRPPAIELPQLWAEGKTPAELLPEREIQHPYPLPGDKRMEGIVPERCVKIGRYVFCTAPVIQPDAASACQEWGAALAALETEAENIVAGRLTRRLSEKPMWIGLSDAEEEGRWLWSGGASPAYSGWASEEPNNWGGEEDCAVQNWTAVPLDCSGRGECSWPEEPSSWNDIHCRSRSGFICEIESGG